MGTSSISTWPTAPELASAPGALRQAADTVALAPRECLFRIGETPSAMYWVLEGELRLRRLSPEGDEILLQRARRGFFAEASLEASRYHCDAVATEASRVLRFPLALFRRSLEQDAAFRGAWMNHLAREVRRLRAQCERMALKSAAARVLHYLDSEGSGGVLVLTQSRKAWAAELGLSHEALYRTLARLQQEGRLCAEGNTLYRA